MGKKTHVKTQGSAQGTRPNLVFYSIFLSLRKSSMDFSWCICLPGGLPGVPPTTAKKWSFLNKIVVQERPFFEACQNLIFGWFAGWLASDVWKYEKVQQSRVPARFCCLEVRKSATVSCSRSLLLFGSTKKCNSLVFPLAFAVRKYEKVQQSRLVIAGYSWL